MSLSIVATRTWSMKRWFKWQNQKRGGNKICSHPYKYKGSNQGMSLQFLEVALRDAKEVNQFGTVLSCWF